MLSPLVDKMPKTSPLGHAKHIRRRPNSPNSFRLVCSEDKAESTEADTVSDTDSETVHHADNDADTNPDADIGAHKGPNDFRVGLSVPAFGYKITPKMLFKMLRMLGHIRHTHHNSAGDCMCVHSCAHVYMCCHALV